MTTLTLGAFVFQNFEVPEHIPFGTEQSLVVHRLVGGTKHVQAMGALPTSISWSGWFTGPNAVARAQQLETTVQQGSKVSLTWDGLSYSVIVASIVCEYRMSSRITYTVTCEPISNDSQPSTATQSADTDQIVADDVSSAGTLATGVGDTSLVSTVAAVATAVAALGTLASASVAAVKATGTIVTTAQNAATVSKAAASASVAAAAGAFDTTPSGLAAFTDALSAAATASANASSLAVLSSTLTRLSVNLTADINAAKTRDVLSGDLYHIAAQEYGDPTMWTVIANANGLTDPEITGPMTLAIPPKPTASSGGVLNA